MVLIISILVAIVAAPFVVYLCAKLGTYGALVGRRKFYQNYPETPN